MANFYRPCAPARLGSNETRLTSGDRVAFHDVESFGHLEAFFGVPCGRRILPSEFEAPSHEIAAIANHAADRSY